MATLGMNGPYDFTSANIDKIVTQESAGNYCLGHMNGDSFRVKYVGRSDSDVKAELKNRLDSTYKKFKFSYATSPQAAFEKECKNYHDFGESEQLDNKVHPARRAGKDWKCPVCKVFG